MGEGLGIEQLNDSRDRRYGHHDQMGQTIPMNTDEKLLKMKQSTKDSRLTQKDKNGAYSCPCGDCQLLFF
jgi:hypothetical protein